jgi:hypothetical protein
MTRRLCIDVMRRMMDEEAETRAKAKGDGQGEADDGRAVGAIRFIYMISCVKWVRGII